MSDGITLKQMQALRNDLNAPRLVDQPVFELEGRRPDARHSGMLAALRLQPAETSDEVAKLRSALAVLSPDAPRGTGSLYVSGELTGDYWLMVIWGIRSLDWSCGKEIAREWSMRDGCPKYTEDGFEKAWNDYKPDHVRGVGVGSVYKLAQHHGWAYSVGKHAVTDAMTYQSDAANKPRYKILRSADIASQPSLQWRIRGVLPAYGLAAFFGPSGSGKSFLAMSAAAAIADGMDWFGHRVYQAPVVYVMLEGEAGLKNRVAALEQKLKHPLPRNFGAVVQSFAINQACDVEALAEVVPEGAVLFIDTLNRAAPTADENSPKDMGEILQGAKALATSTSGLVVIVHHTGKDQSKGLRGHSSLHAALDTAIEVERSGNKRAWSVAKAKDGEDGQKVPFRLEICTLGADEEGGAITSCTVEWDQVGVFQRSEPKGRSQKLALNTIRASLLIDDAVVKGMAGSPADVPCIRVDEAVRSVAETLTGSHQKQAKPRGSSARKGTD